MTIVKILKRIWHFIWVEDSVASWIVNVILAFVIVKFLIYPGLGLILGTPFPIVAVVSNSMEHDTGFDSWWTGQSDWYLKNNITKSDMQNFQFHNGFNKGDIMILKKASSNKVKLGEIIVFKGNSKDPIIHRVVAKYNENNIYYLQTKGDHNPMSYSGLDELRISEDRIYGKAILRIPYLGWIKIAFVSLWR